MTKNHLAEFIEGNHKSLVSFVKSKLNESSRRDSEDIVQDVMLSLLDAPGITDSIVNISSYVFRALRNRIIDEYRKPKNQTQSLDEENHQELSLYDILPDLKYEPAGSYKRANLAKEIKLAIQSLPESQQQVIIETEFNGRSIKELARLTKTPQGTLLARKHRGIKTIQKKFNHIKEEHNALYNT